MTLTDRILTVGRSGWSPVTLRPPHPFPPDAKLPLPMSNPFTELRSPPPCSLLVPLPSLGSTDGGLDAFPLPYSPTPFIPDGRHTYSQRPSLSLLPCHSELYRLLPPSLPLPVTFPLLTYKHPLLPSQHSVLLSFRSLPISPPCISSQPTPLTYCSLKLLLAFLRNLLPSVVSHQPLVPSLYLQRHLFLFYL